MQILIYQMSWDIAELLMANFPSMFEECWLASWHSIQRFESLTEKKKICWHEFLNKERSTSPLINVHDSLTQFSDYFQKKLLIGSTYGAKQLFSWRAAR